MLEDFLETCTWEHIESVIASSEPDDALGLSFEYEYMEGVDKVLRGGHFTPSTMALVKLADARPEFVMRVLHKYSRIDIEFFFNILIVKGKKDTALALRTIYGRPLSIRNFQILMNEKYGYDRMREIVKTIFYVATSAEERSFYSRQIVYVLWIHMSSHMERLRFIARWIDNLRRDQHA